ncbi:hypothetical protein TNCV_2125411 [Trichonephila clavipes]|nr:hypothetical protein TNCV_2125411 [Trichonephila clavipes]
MLSCSIQDTDTTLAHIKKQLFNFGGLGTFSTCQQRVETRNLTTEISSYLNGIRLSSELSSFSIFSTSGASWNHEGGAVLCYTKDEPISSSESNPINSLVCRNCFIQW